MIFKTKITGVVALLIVAAGIFLFISIRKFREPAISNVIKTEQVNADPRALFYNAYLSLILPNIGYSIDPSTELIDTSLTKVFLTDISDKVGARLVLRYSYKDCDMCVNSVLKILNKRFPKFDKRIILITDSYSDRDFKIKAIHTTTNFNLYSSINERGLGMSIEGKSFPFMFLLSKNNKVEKIFIPFKEYPEKTEEYISMIEKYL